MVLIFIVGRFFALQGEKTTHMELNIGIRPAPI